MFPIVHSTLSLAALQEVVSAGYGLPRPVTLRYWQSAQSGGNDLYLVSTDAGKFMLRIYVHGNTAVDALAAQIEVLEQLATTGIRLPRVVRLRDGKVILRISVPEGTRYAMLTEFIKGDVPGGSITDAEAQAFGAALATFHRSANALAVDLRLPIHDREYLLDEPLGVLTGYCVEMPVIQQYLAELSASIAREIEALDTAAPAFGLCHGDAHKSNLLVDNEALTLLDFDCMGYGWRAYDLATFRWSISRPEWFGGLRADRARSAWDAFLDGYAADHALTAEMLQSLSSFVLVRHLWWMAIDLRKIRDGKIGASWLNEEWWEKQRKILDELRVLS
ncbi:MAG: phosphotransferase [Anaerolineae bacterium]|nr:phosphotransferase [Anaerolineae bacterium]